MANNVKYENYKRYDLFEELRQGEDVIISTGTRNYTLKDGYITVRIKDFIIS